MLDSKLGLYLMEANMSPNLSSKHFAMNRLLYEQVVYNLLRLNGVLRGGVFSQGLDPRTADEEEMQVGDGYGGEGGRKGRSRELVVPNMSISPPPPHPNKKGGDAKWKLSGNVSVRICKNLAQILLQKVAISLMGHCWLGHFLFPQLCILPCSTLQLYATFCIFFL